MTMGPPHLGQKPLGLVFWGRGCCSFGLRRGGVECGKAQRQKLSSVATGEETEVADADKTFGEQMQEEATQELIE